MIVKPVSNPEHFRENIIQYIDKFVENETYRKNIEKSIYNYCVFKAKKEKIVKKWENVHFVLIYLNKFKIIFHNIKNPVILDKIKERKIQPHKVAFMSHLDLLPEKWNVRIEEKKLRLQNKFFPKIRHQLIISVAVNVSQEHVLIINFRHDLQMNL